MAAPVQQSAPPRASPMLEARGEAWKGGAHSLQQHLKRWGCFSKSEVPSLPSFGLGKGGSFFFVVEKLPVWR